MAPIIKFDSFCVDAEKRLLERNGEVITLESKTFETLLVLLRHRGETVSKDALIREVWKDVAVSDDSLTQQISRLRKALGEKPKAHRFIVTVPGVGYKFVADVQEISTNGATKSAQIQSENPNETNQTALENLSSDEKQISEKIFPDKDFAAKADAPVKNNSVKNTQTAAQKSKKYLAIAVAILGAAAIGLWLWFGGSRQAKNDLRVKSIAVLPFKTFSPDEQSETLKTGMADALITRLSRLEQIKDLPTGAVLRFNKLDEDQLAAGKEVVVDAVLEGRIEKEGERLRVTAQPIKTADCKTL